MSAFVSKIKISINPTVKMKNRKKILTVFRKNDTKNKLVAWFREENQRYGKGTGKRGIGGEVRKSLRGSTVIGNF